jgi:hypothetical protein
MFVALATISIEFVSAQSIRVTRQMRGHTGRQPRDTLAHNANEDAIEDANEDVNDVRTAGSRSSIRSAT